MTDKTALKDDDPFDRSEFLTELVEMTAAKMGKHFGKTILLLKGTMFIVMIDEEGNSVKSRIPYICLTADFCKTIDLVKEAFKALIKEAKLVGMIKSK